MQSIGYEANSILGDLSTIFVDRINSNLRLKSGSPAIDAGANVGITNDFDGNVRPQGAGYDIGAFEYVGSPVTPTWIKTFTPVPTSTRTPTRTATSVPTHTRTPIPSPTRTHTLVPTKTFTSVPPTSTKTATAIPTRECLSVTFLDGTIIYVCK